MDKTSATTHLGFTLNGAPVSVEAPPGERLSETLRERLGARDVKVGCNAGDCGACTVLADGQPVCACLMTAAQATGRRIETLAGLVASDPATQALAQRFEDQGAAQCGICTPGMMVSATALLRETATPSEAQVADALGGVLCRCTGYRKIVDAVMGAPARAVPGTGLGAPIRRLDGGPKVRGVEAYGDDVAPPGTREIHVIRSPHPRARFAFDGLEAWAEAQGFDAVLTAEDVPGLNRFGVIPGFVDQPVFAETEARFRGEAVAALIGPPEVIASLDPDRLPVTWEPLPAVEAMDAPGEDLHSERPENIMCRGRVRSGDPDAALVRADIVAEATFETGFVEHAYIEPEAGFAEIVGGRVQIHACTQAPVMDREAVEAILGQAPGSVRIIPTGVGGGFGSKLDVSVQPILALAALKTGLSVRLTYSRTESMQSTTKRHPARMMARIGATSDGLLSGMVFQGDFNTGAYASWGPTVANRVPVHASGPYRVADYLAETRALHTNGPPSGAFRGFGVPQAAIAQEVLFDELAERLGLDPLEFRMRNVLRAGVPTVCGQVFAQGVGIGACLEALRPAWTEARRSAEAHNRAQGPTRRGVGVAAGWYGCGNTSLPNPSTIRAGVTPAGEVVLHQGAMDIGQGANTVIAQIFAEALGVDVTSLRLIGPDTDLTPDCGKTSASRQTFVTGNAARLAGEALRAQILRRMNAGAATRLEIGAGAIRGDGAGEIDLARLAPNDLGYVLMAEETFDPPTKPLDADGQGVPYAQFGYAAHIAEVEVDLSLGTTRATRFVAAHDVGAAVNPLLIEGQVEGGIAQGLGMALMEEYIPGRTENLHDYLIPTIGDMPAVETLIVEDPDAHGPFGVKGLGEHVLIPTAPALLNAITHATGVRMRRVPVTPSRLHAALKAQGRGMTKEET